MGVSGRGVLNRSILERIASGLGLVAVSGVCWVADAEWMVKRMRMKRDNKERMRSILLYG